MQLFRYDLKTVIHCIQDANISSYFSCMYKYLCFIITWIRNKEYLFTSAGNTCMLLYLVYRDHPHATHPAVLKLVVAV